MKLNEAIDFAAKKKAEDKKWMCTITFASMPFFVVQLHKGKYEFFPDLFGMGIFVAPPEMYTRACEDRRDLTDEELNSDSFDVRVEDMEDF